MGKFETNPNPLYKYTVRFKRVPLDGVLAGLELDGFYGVCTIFEAVDQAARCLHKEDITEAWYEENPRYRKH